MNKKNKDIRPSIAYEDLKEFDDRILNGLEKINCTINFRNSYVETIDTIDQAILNDFRILHHMERYIFAKNYIEKNELKDLKIIDIGIGEGLAIAKLFNHLSPNIISKVVGLEIDEAVSKNLMKQYQNIEVINQGIDDYITKDKFNIILCYELLGNESLKSDNDLLDSLDNLCAKNGHIFFSSKIYRNKELGKLRKKRYDARIYDTKSFVKLMSNNLSKYKLNYFSQTYPLKRMKSSESGVWENPQLNIEADFAICVAKKTL